jgi:hypothetical protein
MKNLFCLLFCSVFIFGGCNSDLITAMPPEEADVSTEEENEYSIDSYTYSVDYRSLPPSQRKAALQIPNETINKMTTKAIVQAVFDYPMIIDIFLANDFTRGFIGVFGDNNAYLELLRRDETSKFLLERLLATADNIEITLSSYILEYVMTLPKYLSSYNADEMKILAEAIFIKHKIEQNSEINYISVVAIGKTMLAANYTPFVNTVKENPSLQSSINSMEITIEYSEIIIDYGINFINEK